MDGSKPEKGTLARDAGAVRTRTRVDGFCCIGADCSGLRWLGKVTSPACTELGRPAL